MNFSFANKVSELIGQKGSIFRKGQLIPQQEMLEFGIEILVDYYRKKGMIVRNINPSLDKSNPHFIMEIKNGSIYYVAVNAHLYSANSNEIDAMEYSGLRDYAINFGAIPVFAIILFVPILTFSISESSFEGKFLIVYNGLLQL